MLCAHQPALPPHVAVVSLLASRATCAPSLQPHQQRTPVHRRCSAILNTTSHQVQRSFPPAISRSFPYVASARSSSPIKRLAAPPSRAFYCIPLRLCDTLHTSHGALSYPYGLYDEGDEERRSALPRTMQSTGAYCRYVIGFAFASRLVPKSINHASHPPMIPHDDLPDGSPPHVPWTPA